MELNAQRCYQAIRARDTRFDGCFFVGVSTTGIYCRPICTVRTPGRDRCHYFASAAAAEQAGYRPCLRCRPELAPGVALSVAPVDAVRAAARWLARRIDAGALNDGDLEHLASEYGLSSRQLRRALVTEFGVTPIELAQTRRLLLAKQLLTDTALPMTRVAQASGFASVRRFNALFKTRYRLNPSALRRTSVVRASTPVGAADALTLRLAYRPPLAWDALVSFLVTRGAAGVEASVASAIRVAGATRVAGAAGVAGAISVADAAGVPPAGRVRYVRTVSMAVPNEPTRRCNGWFSVEPLPGANALQVQVAAALLPVLTPVLARIRCLFDLDANPRVIETQLAGDARLRPLVVRRPGLRVPGAFDGFELALRAVLGQQVSVKSATTLFGRCAAAFGERADTPHEALQFYAPTAERVAQAGAAQLIKLGLTRQRAETVWHLARAVADGGLRLEPGADIETMLERLQALPGIGPWTAHYIAMRALGYTDAFPHGDLGLAKALKLSDARRLAARAEAWRPWRAYAAVHLWTQLQVGG